MKTCAGRLVLVLLSTIVFASCITVGRQFRPDAVEMIEMGATTKMQVRSLLGEPWRTGQEDGLETWTYGHHRYSAVSRSRTRDLVVRFDTNDFVVSYIYNTTDPP